MILRKALFSLLKTLDIFYSFSIDVALNVRQSFYRAAKIVIAQMLAYCIAFRYDPERFQITIERFETQDVTQQCLIGLFKTIYHVRCSMTQRNLQQFIKDALKHNYL